MTEKITLSGVPETMPQIVYACARESEGRGTIHDPKAEEIIRRLDYDFSLADSDTAMCSGVIARTLVLDRLARSWLAQHPGAVVVNLACGLDTRCCRVDGYAHWYDLDLPETIAVRERLLPEHGAISQLAMSAMDDWGGEITEQGASVLVIIEGLTMYLPQADVQRIFAVTAGRFPEAAVFVETMSPMVVRRFREKSIEGSHAKFTWGVKGGAALAALLPDFRFRAAQPDRRHGGVCPALQGAGQDLRCAEYLQQDHRAGKSVSRRQGALRRYAAIEERRRGSEKYHERCLNKETYVCKRPNFCALAHSSGGRFRAAARFDSRAAQMEEFDGSRL